METLIITVSSCFLFNFVSFNGIYYNFCVGEFNSEQLNFTFQFKPNLRVTFFGPFSSPFKNGLSGSFPMAIFTHDVTRCKKRSKVPLTKTG